MSESNSLSGINVQPILKYFEKTWIKVDYLPEECNKFGELDDRTNNYVESYNHQVNKKLKTKPNILKFCDFMIAEENKMEVCSLQSDKEPFSKKVNLTLLHFFHLSL